MADTKFAGTNQLVEAKFNSLRRLFRSYKSWNKCFCIGSNKTATTSLDGIMQHVLGFKSNQAEVETYASIQCMRGNYDPLKQIISEYDFHNDIPVSQGNIYAILDAIFPNSKFILTTRETQDWSKSFATFYAKYFYDALLKDTSNQFFQEQTQFPGYGASWVMHFWNSELDILRNEFIDLGSRETGQKQIATNKEFLQAISKKFDNRNQEIVNFFSLRKKDLLVIDITKSNSIKALLEFLELPLVLDCNWPNVRPKSDKKESSSNVPDLKIEFLKHKSMSDFLKC